jgi:predicted dehydrogenase
MADKLRVAVIGAGIAARHLTAYTRLPELYDVTVICSAHDPRMPGLAEKHGIARQTNDFAETLRMDDVDVVDICTPPNLHFDMAVGAIGAGKHVICEKPLFGSVAEVDEVSRLVEANGRQLMPIFQYRFGNGLQKLKFLIERGLTGKAYVSTVETHWTRDADYYAVPWRGKWQTELGGGLLGHAIHAHDMVNYLLGPSETVYALAATRVNRIEVEDCAAIALKLQDGSLATLSMTLGSSGEISRLRFCFENLTAESSLDPYTPSRDPWTFTGHTPELQARVDEALSAYRPQSEGYTRQFELFHAAVTAGAPLPVSLADARASLELITAMYHSAETGTPVAFPIAADHPKYRSWLPDEERGRSA